MIRAIITATLFILLQSVLFSSAAFASDPFGKEAPPLYPKAKNHISRLIIKLEKDLKDHPGLISENDPLWRRLVDNGGFFKKVKKGTCKGETFGVFGQCYVSDARHCRECVCDYYVKKSVEFLDGCGQHGYPLNPYSHCSTGCVSAPNSPKGIAPRGMTTCWPGYTGEMCGVDILQNAGHQILKALKDSISQNKDHCNIGKMLKCSK